MQRTLFIILLLVLPACSNIPDTPSSDRLEAAKANSGQAAKDILAKYNLDWNNFELYLRAFKKEKELEVWAKEKGTAKFTKVAIFLFCKYSGELGPKRKEGDLQIPEGFYHIDRFNPKSKFHLSLGINYPNAADRQHADRSAPGSDIFIHGSCETVGCIPITDAKIELLYILAEQAFNLGQKQIPVHIFPVQMSQGEFKLIRSRQPEHSSFWSDLFPMYKTFNRYRQLPNFSVDQNGKYKVERLR